MIPASCPELQKRKQTSKQLSESHHSKSNKLYKLYEYRNTNSTSGNSVLDTKKLQKAVFREKKRKTLSEKWYYSMSVIHCVEDNLIIGKLHDICFLAPSRYIKLLLKLPWLSQSNFILQFPLYKISTVVLLYFR